MRHTAITGFIAAGLATCALSSGCADLDLDAPPELIHARFDPDARVIPMPTDIVRDAEASRLDIPLDGDLTAAEEEFYRALNTQDAWSTAMPASLEFTAPISEASITNNTVQVWHMRATPTRVDDLQIHLDESGTRLTIDPPRYGWHRGDRYVAVVRGGSQGLYGRGGEPVEADAAFYFLRLTDRLDTLEHRRAFPGDNAAERQDAADQLEEIRADLAPDFDFIAESGIPREEVAALWSFSVTEATELAMDKASQRMPLPIDLLLDPDTLKVDMPAAPWDSRVVRDAKIALSRLDGFSTSAPVLFGFTAAMDIETLTADSLRLFVEEEDDLREIEAEIRVLDDHQHVEIYPVGGPLEEKTRYVVTVADSVRDSDGQPVALMPAGALMRLSQPVADDGQSLVGDLTDDDAGRIEQVRARVRPMIRDSGDELLVAWSFVTQSITEPMHDLLAAPATLDVDPDPTYVADTSAGDALREFPLGITSLGNVGRVYHGTIKSPVFLDPVTRAFRTDGGHEVIDIPFTMALPKNIDEGTRLPAVIFGHGLSTERHFVLALANALTKKGFAAIAVDLPYHGLRTSCFSEDEARESLDPITGELTPLGDACVGDATCSEDGRCVLPDGSPGELAMQPVINMPAYSGTTYIEIDHIANTADHMRQSLLDMSALTRSLREGDWKSVIGFDIDGDEIHYVGVSLGGILGSVLTANSPHIKNAVLNVPGANLVELFSESPTFKDRINALLEREGTERGEYEAHKLLAAGHWITDGVDPQSFADKLQDGHGIMVQMATLDTVIPNQFTRLLADLADVPRRDYIASHAFLNLPLEPEYWRGTNDMANFIAGED